MTTAADNSSPAFEGSLAAIDGRVRRRLDEIGKGLGRPLRVLHVGNIANNAYVNAKIMRRYGIEADVLVLDYYHIMGCPEWEEGVIETLEGTQLDPDWHLTKVGNFSRPDWFLQGPASLCSGYLTAKAENSPWRAKFQHALIDWNLRCRGAVRGPRRRAYSLAWSCVRAMPGIKYRLGNWLYLAGYHARRLSHLVLHRARMALYYTRTALYYLRYYTLRALSRVRSALYHLRYYTLRALSRVRSAVRSWLIALVRSMVPVIVPFLPRKIKDILKKLRDKWRLRSRKEAAKAVTEDAGQTTSAPIVSVAPSVVARVARENQPVAPPAEPAATAVEAAPAPVQPPAAVAQAAALKLSGEPSRWPKVEPPSADDMSAYGVTADKFRKAFAYYDVVQGYAVDGIYPLLAGKTKAYACYEHGTLRDIPYQPNAQGRMCAHAYSNAPAVFITNTDCVVSAANLGIGPERRFPIPHAFDSDRVLRFRAEHMATCKPHNRPVTFIAPARHHWKHGEFVSWLKGNDVPIRAARLMADQGLDFKIIFVRWGQEIAESEKLIEELDVGKHFEWIEPVPKDRLWQYYMTCNGVLDQFVIPAIGGVSFETLAFGRPLFTRIDEPVFKDFFGEVPPLLNVHTPEDLAEAMGRLVRHPDCYDQLSPAALDWTANHHSSQRILEVLLNGYDRILMPGAEAGADQSLATSPPPADTIAAQ